MRLVPPPTRASGDGGGEYHETMPRHKPRKKRGEKRQTREAIARAVVRRSYQRAAVNSARIGLTPGALAGLAAVVRLLWCDADDADAAGLARDLARTVAGRERIADARRERADLAAAGLVPRLCAACHGSGHAGPRDRCPDCGGDGWTAERAENPDPLAWVECPERGAAWVELYPSPYILVRTGDTAELREVLPGACVVYDPAAPGGLAAPDVPDRWPDAPRDRFNRPYRVVASGPLRGHRVRDGGSAVRGGPVRTAAGVVAFRGGTGVLAALRAEARRLATLATQAPTGAPALPASRPRTAEPTPNPNAPAADNSGGRQ